MLLKMHNYSCLFIFLVLIIITNNNLILCLSSYSSSSSPDSNNNNNPSHTQLPAADLQLIPLNANYDNETIFRISKQLCWNCIAESIQFLFAHNLVRAAKWELPLMWDYALERYARWWAGQRIRDCKVEHSFPENGFKLGENIYWGSGSSWKPSDAVDAWADEGQYYDYATNSCEGGKVCGHYTQIVWKTTRRIGCVRVVCDDGDVFITCNYDPIGNYVGQRPY